MSLLSLRKVTKRYGNVVAASHVDLDVAAGSRTAIVGPSGSGKTTLLRLIAGFETLDGGSISLDGELLADESNSVPAYRRGIGYVAQEGALFPHLTVAENIAFGLSGHAERHARVDALLDLVGLARTMADRRPHELSGGQQQRVALARALARRPRLMLLDEPFSALDTGLREDLRDLVAEVLSSAGVTTVFVTHDQSEALSFADQVALMRDGVIVQAGSPEDLYFRPRDAEAARFFGEAIVVAGVEAGALGLHIAPDAPAMLRPEQFVLSTGGSDSPVSGRVLTRTFRGPTCRLLIETTGTPPFLQFKLDYPSATAPEVGAAIGLKVVGEPHPLTAPSPAATS